MPYAIQPIRGHCHLRQGRDNASYSTRLRVVRARVEAVNWKPMTLTSWGRLSHVPVSACEPHTVDEVRTAIGAADNRGILAVGLGRSYGDVGLNSGGRAVLTARLNEIHSFDPGSGTLICGPGVAFRQLLRDFLPRGYIAPVTPGTAFVSLGGAVANDVHGKNHDQYGSFGDHVKWIDLILPSGDMVRASPEKRPDLFAATIGGIGLTGIIMSICFTMRKVPSNAVMMHEERITDLDHFFARLEEARKNATYSVGWLDALARGPNLGRGILITGEPSSNGLPVPSPKRLKIPFDLPGFVLNARTIGVFNKLYYHRLPARGRQQRELYEKFLYPLDAVLEWNRIYGNRGFYQFQAVLPDASSTVGICRLLEEIVKSRLGSFLVVLKTLRGEGRGYLSFPMRGYTLALDFPRKRGTEELLGSLERITLDYGGRIYLAKDACMSPAGFESMYPKLDALRSILDEIDPEGRMNSDLARRLHIRRHQHRNRVTGFSCRRASKRRNRC